jgi:hypothetical protein
VIDSRLEKSLSDPASQKSSSQEYRRGWRIGPIARQSNDRYLMQETFYITKEKRNYVSMLLARQPLSARKLCCRKFLKKQLLAPLIASIHHKDMKFIEYQKNITRRKPLESSLCGAWSGNLTKWLPKSHYPENSESKIFDIREVNELVP